MTTALASPALALRVPSRPWPAGVPAFFVRLVVPGYVQWSWGQKRRAQVFAGTHASALATALVLWGTPAAWLFLGVAICCRTAAWIDAHRQDPFSGFTPPTVLAATGGAIALVVHAPLLVVLTLTAWPGRPSSDDSNVYLINRLAYRTDRPSPGDWIWLHGSASRVHHLARVIAVGGQEVEWTGKRWRVDGRDVDVEKARKVFGYAERLRFHVPGNHTLLDSEIEFKRDAPPAPLIVENGQIAGRVWARCAPFWDRRLL